MQKENIKINDKVILNRSLYRWAAPHSVFVRSLVNYRIQDLQRLPLLLSSVRGEFQIKVGRTSLLNKKAFTLIELLVVVLIIGILATVAFAQYNRIKLRTVFNIAAATTRQIYEAQRLFYLENGRYSNSLAELPIQIPEMQVYAGKRVGCHANYYGPSCWVWKGNNPNNPQYEVWIVYAFNDNKKGRLACNVYGGQEIYKSFCSKLTGDPTGSDVGYAWQYLGPIPQF